MGISHLHEKERFWLVYLSCLERPRSITEISSYLGLMKVGKEKAPSNLFNDNLAKEMIRDKAITYVSISRPKRYLSNIDYLEYSKEITEFLSHDWVRRELLATEKMLKLYKNDVKLIKEMGSNFIPTVLSIISAFYVNIQFIRSYPKATKKMSKLFLSEVFSLFNPLNVTAYIDATADNILSHEKEIIAFVEKIINKKHRKK